ncbi:WD40 repeat domain-containing protein [Desulfurobacterium thermolithotrophum]|uniref:WD40 repeat domain-containing protein n=1 Tax=Desulfurobacterium thermolithotrophum TaxID=64160 RepID=UPI0013D433B5|nr:WD40 repeat domain-containing protein [Desulfurobacterium thermolithotrophum]
MKKVVSLIVKHLLYICLNLIFIIFSLNSLASPQKEKFKLPKIRTISNKITLDVWEKWNSKIWILSVTFSPNGNWIAYGSYSRFNTRGTVTIIDPLTGNRKAVLYTTGRQVEKLAVSPDGNLIAAGNAGGTIDIFDVKSKEKIKTLREHKRTISSIAFSPNGKLLASADYDGVVKLWDLNTWEPIKTFSGKLVAFSPDSKYLAILNRKELFIYDISKGNTSKILSLKNLYGPVDTICFSPDGTLIAFSNFDNIYILKVSKDNKMQIKLKMKKVIKGTQYRKRMEHYPKYGKILSMSFSPDSKLIAIGTINFFKNRPQAGVVAIFDVKTGTCIKLLEKYRNDVRSVTFSPDGSMIAFGCHSGELGVLKVEEPFFSLTTLDILDKDKLLSIPKGTVIKAVKGNGGIYIVYPIYGKLKEGRLNPLYYSADPILVFKESPLLPYPGSQYPVGTIKKGEIVDKKQILITRDKKYLYLDRKGFISANSTVKIKPCKISFLAKIEGTVLKTLPNENASYTVPTGTVLFAKYFCPYFNYYLVTSPSGKSGWVSAQYLEKLPVKDINKDAVALESTNLFFSVSSKNHGIPINQGEIIKVVFKLKNYPLYYVKKGKNKGLINKDSIAFIKRINPQKLWTITDTTLLKAPQKSADVIRNLPKFTELKVLGRVNDFYYVEVISIKLKGWIPTELTTLVKPDKLS